LVVSVVVVESAAVAPLGTVPAGALADSIRRLLTVRIAVAVARTRGGAATSAFVIRLRSLASAAYGTARRPLRARERRGRLRSRACLGVGLRPPAGEGASVTDHQIHSHIESLVAEEHALFERGERMSSEERNRLGEINVQLDRLWDLLRQRRARAEFGQNPDTAIERSANTVEKYLQ
jgi:hypothetical protein